MCVNNNIIYINENNDNTNQNCNHIILNYKLSEYKWTDSDIIYSFSNKNNILLIIISIIIISFLLILKEHKIIIFFNIYKKYLPWLMIKIFI